MQNVTFVRLRSVQIIFIPCICTCKKKFLFLLFFLFCVWHELEGVCRAGNLLQNKDHVEARVFSSRETLPSNGARQYGKNNSTFG